MGAHSNSLHLLSLPLLTIMVLLSSCTASRSHTDRAPMGVMGDAYEVWEGTWETDGHKVPFTLVVTLDGGVYGNGGGLSFEAASGRLLEVPEGGVFDRTGKLPAHSAFDFNLVAQSYDGGNLRGEAFGFWGLTTSSFSVHGYWTAEVSGRVDWRKHTLWGECEFEDPGALAHRRVRRITWEVEYVW